MYVLLSILFVLIVLVIFTSIQFFNILFRDSAPFLSTKKTIIDQVLPEINLVAGDCVYELGCGNASLSFAIKKKFPLAKITAIEYSFLPFVFARFLAIARKSGIRILKQNIFNVNLGDAKLIYCYLNPPTMEKLSSKFKTECLTGARIISYRFTLPGFTPEKIIDDQSGKIYFYQL